MLLPFQFGFGVRGGREALVHAVRTFVKANRLKPKAIVNFDFIDAFNTLFRKIMLARVKEICSEIFPMLYQS